MLRRLTERWSTWVRQIINVQMVIKKKDNEGYNFCVKKTNKQNNDDTKDYSSGIVTLCVVVM